MSYRIFSLGENALTIDFGNVISAELNDRVLELADFIEQNNFEGFIELVPAYSSLTIFYDPVCVKKNFPNFPTVFSAIRNFVESALKSLPGKYTNESRLIEIPVCYRQESAPDLEAVASHAGLSKDEVVKIHTAPVYRVFMIGFLPAFAYLGELDKRIAMPRKTSPRTRVERGSVGIAGNQTGIYPLDSPGGWQIIGKTALEMFQPDSEKISLLQTGDRVKFYSL